MIIEQTSEFFPVSYLEAYQASTDKDHESDELLEHSFTLEELEKIDQYIDQVRQSGTIPELEFYTDLDSFDFNFYGDDFITMEIKLR